MSNEGTSGRPTSCPAGRGRAGWLADNLAGMRKVLGHAPDPEDAPPEGIEDIEAWRRRVYAARHPRCHRTRPR